MVGKWPLVALGLTSLYALQQGLINVPKLMVPFCGHAHWLIYSSLKNMHKHTMSYAELIFNAVGTKTSFAIIYYIASYK